MTPARTGLEGVTAMQDASIVHAGDVARRHHHVALIGALLGQNDKLPIGGVRRAGSVFEIHTRNKIWDTSGIVLKFIRKMSVNADPQVSFTSAYSNWKCSDS